MDSQKHLEFHDRQNAAMHNLIDTLRPTIPKDWAGARLELEALYSPLTKTRSIQHRLTNSITGEHIRDFPSDLFLATTTLHAVFCDYDQTWKRATIHLTFNQNGILEHLESRYTYDP